MKYDTALNLFGVRVVEKYVILNFDDVKRCLSTDCGELLRTYDYCEGTIYSTWEQFYENLLSQVALENFGFYYSKIKLNHWFMNRKCGRAVC